MKKIVLTLMTLIQLSAQADRILPLDSMTIKCVENVGILAVVPNEIEIDFFEDKMYVTLNGEERVFDTILKAGTEGGAPYIQFVANGFVNFIISGPQLTDAFNGKPYEDSRRYRNGGLFINVDNLQKYQPDFKAACSGYFAF